MHKSRLEAFSDGVMAIIITIMVLELKVPHGSDWQDLLALRYTAFCYVISFIFLAIYWNNHHHLLQTVKHVNGAILWANTHLLFWLSLVPFVTAWSGEHAFAPIPTMLYGIVLLMSAVAFYILVRCLIAQEGAGSIIAQAIGRDYKGKVSLLMYAVAIPFACWYSWIAVSIYVSIAMVWFIPDKRIEKQLQ